VARHRGPDLEAPGLGRRRLRLLHRRLHRQRRDHDAQATYESLGSPSYIAPVYTNGGYVYRYVVEDSVSYNAYVSYRFACKSKWIGDTSVRLGVVNVTDEIPPLSSDSRGYDPSVYNLMARGRSWSLQITRRL
jgi:iron complex outermembrane receptor protein